MPTRAVGPAVAATAPACRARRYPPRAAAVTARSPSAAAKLVQTEAPSGLAAPSVGHSRHRHRKDLAAVPPIPSRRPAGHGALALAMHPCEGLSPVGLTERDSIVLGNPGALRHSGERSRSLVQLIRGGVGAGRPIFDKLRIAGSVHTSKHGANMGTKRTRKKTEVMTPQVRMGEVFTFRPELGKRDPAGGLATG